MDYNTCLLVATAHGHTVKVIRFAGRFHFFEIPSIQLNNKELEILVHVIK